MGNDVGDSFNLVQHNVSFAVAVLNGWEGNLMFVPKVIGDMTYLGKRLSTETSPGNPVAYACDTCVGYNQSHQSWDGESSHLAIISNNSTNSKTVVAMYYAICGLYPAFKLVHDHGAVDIFPNGSAWWNETNTGIHSQNALKLALDNNTFASAMESILIWEPRERRTPMDACDLLKFN